MFIYSIYSRPTFSILENLRTTAPEICNMRPGLLLGCCTQEHAPPRSVRAEEGAELAQILGVTFKEIVMNNGLEMEFVSLVKELREQTIQPVANHREQNPVEAHAM